MRRGDGDSDRRKRWGDVENATELCDFSVGVSVNCNFLCGCGVGLRLRCDLIAGVAKQFGDGVACGFPDCLRAVGGDLLWKKRTRYYIRILLIHIISTNNINYFLF